MPETSDVPNVHWRHYTGVWLRRNAVAKVGRVFQYWSEATLLFKSTAETFVVHYLGISHVLGTS